MIDQKGVKVDQKVLSYLVDMKFPAVTSHLEKVGVDLSAVVVSWFLCLFVTSLDQEGAVPTPLPLKYLTLADLRVCGYADLSGFFFGVSFVVLFCVILPVHVNRG
jgi:Rab-GTPase-TBC domain